MLKQIDFYIDVIDNYGDMGFAVNLALIMLKNDENLFIRIFSNDENLFKNMIKNNIEYLNIQYYDLSKINSLEPNNLIFNFFDKKINFDFLNSKNYKIKIINFGYFLMHKGVENLHLTNYKVGNIDVTHFIPSILKNTAGVLINKSIISNTKNDLGKLLFSKYSLNSSINYNHKWVSIFVYKETLDDILEKINIDDDIVYFIFGYTNLDIKKENIIVMPFFELQDYNDFLSICDINFVRGENSLISSLIHGKITLWDIYKEDNNAHLEKINDFLDFLDNFSFYNKNYSNLMINFNKSLNKVKYFSMLINEYSDYEIMFKNIGIYVNNNCDLYEKIKKILN